MVSCDENVTTFALAGGGGGVQKGSSKAGADEGKKSSSCCTFHSRVYLFFILLCQGGVPFPAWLLEFAISVASIFSKPSMIS